MAVSKLIYGGRTLFDITDTTATEKNTLEGVVGYSADGERFVGTANINDFYATGRKITVTLPASGWTASGDVYIQTVAADVSSENKGIAQILLSDDVDTRLSELDADENLSKVDLLDGSVYVEIEELPEVALTMEIAVISGLSASNKAALMCVDSKGFAFVLSADAWTQDGDTYTQTVAVDGLTDGVVFGDVLIADDDSTAETMIYEANAVSKFEVSNGSITAICYGYLPETDLQYFIKLFKE